MRIAALTTVTDESQTMLSSGLATARTIEWSVISALPAILIAHRRFSAHAGSGHGPKLLSRNHSQVAELMKWLYVC
jgi:hypothetical protein